MALSPKLEIRQGQTLIMTPQLMQAIKLLQMSSLDLTSYVEAEMERNPLLERGDSEGERAEESQPGGDEGGTAEAGPEGDSDWIQAELPDNSREITDRLDADLGNLYPDDPSTSARRGPPPGTHGS